MKRGAAAIAGSGSTPYYFRGMSAPQTQYELIGKAILAACADAGIGVEEIDGISAGGMPTRVKCLHALAGHALAAGPGVNPIGDRALAISTWSPERCVCTQPGSGG